MLRSAITLAVALAAVQLVAGQGALPVWPQPVTFTWGSQLAYIGNKFNIACVSSVCPAALNKSMTRYTQIVFFAGAPGSSSPSQLLGVDVSVRADAPLIMGMNESYSLSVQLPRAKIYADNQYGEQPSSLHSGLALPLALLR